MTGRMWVEAWSPEYGTSYGITAPAPDAPDADGRLRRELPLSVIGYVKSQGGRYLDASLRPIIPALGPGQRTPVFSLIDKNHHHYSWYLCLAASPRGHPWAGVARCEVSASLP